MVCKRPGYPEPFRGVVLGVPTAVLGAGRYRSSPINMWTRARVADYRSGPGSSLSGRPEVPAGSVDGPGPCALLLSITTSPEAPLPRTCRDTPSTTLEIGNIPYDATEEQLIQICEEVGPVVSFRLVLDKETGRPKGYGFCEYKDEETALSARRNLQGYEINGRQLRVDFAENDKGVDRSREQFRDFCLQDVVNFPKGDNVTDGDEEEGRPSAQIMLGMVTPQMMEALGNQKTASALAKSSVQDNKQHNKPIESFYHDLATSNKETSIVTLSRPSESQEKNVLANSAVFQHSSLPPKQIPFHAYWPPMPQNQISVPGTIPGIAGVTMHSNVQAPSLPNSISCLSQVHPSLMHHSKPVGITSIVHQTHGIVPHISMQQSVLPPLTSQWICSNFRDIENRVRKDNGEFVWICGLQEGRGSTDAGFKGKKAGDVGSVDWEAVRLVGESEMAV
ncbi:hypothetical protein KSP40_PGU019927 [Platanthera guangdongensis]|uniref:RRM domain-containing protein n=1 Tax=Platanthera guangdongensis TaxID=2320717 RepID=A0ABR2M610_9ASPA